MKAPERIQPKSLADYLDVLSKTVFRTGISWRVVDAKWPGTREVFREFDPVAISHFTGAELERLAEDKRIIRNRRKIEAIVSNARRMLELDKEHGGFRNYLRSHGGFEVLVKDLRKQFKFLGDMGAYHFLWVVSEEVPSYEEWCALRGVAPAHSSH
ncbi:MAG: DNA-3-methyladenine glycosylase I [Dehalococcoidia bacterium]